MSEQEQQKIYEQMSQRLDAQDKALTSLLADMAHIRRYFKWMLIGTLVTFVVPLIAAVIIVPIVIGKYMKTLEGIF